MSDNGNEPAFARPESEFTYGSTGLTKREWFAGMAMVGNVANSDPQMRPSSHQDVARWSVELADALLAELAKAGSEPAP